MSATGPLVFFGGPCHGGLSLVYRHLRVRARYTRVCTRGQHAGVHARTDREPTGRTASAGDRWRKEYTRNTLEIGNALPTAVDGSIENEIAARRTVGGHVSGRIY